MIIDSTPTHHLQVSISTSIIVITLTHFQRKEHRHTFIEFRVYDRVDASQFLLARFVEIGTDGSSNGQLMYDAVWELVNMKNPPVNVTAFKFIQEHGQELVRALQR